MNSSNTRTTPIIFILCLITTMGRFVMDNYLPSLPAIGQAFHAPAGQVQLTITLYIFGFGLSQLIYGPLSDRYGRKKILVGGLLLFLLTNIFCAFVHSLTLLLLARLLSGIGMGVCGVLNRAIASDCFHGTAFSKAWSYTTTTVVMVLIFAPLIGSCVQELFGWQANFTLATVFVGIALFIILCKLPETNHSNKLHSLSIQSVFQHYKNLLGSKSFILSTLCYTFAFSGLIAYFQLSPFLLMQQLHLTPVQYGYSSLAIAAGYLIGGLIVRKLAGFLGIKLLLVLGIFLVIASGISMISWNDDEPLALFRILLPTSMYVIGARIIIPNAMASAFTGFRHLGGSASGLIGGIQMLGTACISFIMVHFNNHSALPLAFLFTSIGIASLISFCFLYFYKNKYLYKNLVKLSVITIHVYRTQTIYNRVMNSILFKRYEKFIKKCHIKYKQTLKRIYTPLITLLTFISKLCRHYSLDKTALRYTKWLSEKFQATNLYHYCYSAIQFSIKMTNRRTEKNKTY